jgi:quercetin dioxygenase-like cupin family protein
MFGSRRVAGIACATLFLMAACGGSAAPVAPVAPVAAATPSATPSVTSSILASGPLPSIPAGALFINYLDLPQAAGGVIKHAHIPGFVYAVSGTPEMDVEGAAPAMIQPGNAAFIGSGVMHSHVNPGTSGNDWWFIGLRPAASRPLATIVAGQKELYTTPDLTTIATGSYTEMLTDSRLAAKGVDRQSGQVIRVLYVVEGDVTVSGDAGMVSTASAGQGLYSLPGATLVLTAGAAGAHYITFTMTPAGN